MDTKTIDLETAGQTLRDFRESRGWSRPDLVTRSEVSEKTVINAENGARADGTPNHPYAQTVSKLARPFGRRDGATILEAFGYDSLVEHLWDDEPLISTPELSTAQETIIEKIVEALIELAQSGNAQKAGLVNFPTSRDIPRFVKSKPKPLVLVTDWKREAT